MDALNRGSPAFVGPHGEADLDAAGVGVDGGGKPVVSRRNSARFQRTQEGFHQSTGYGRPQRAAGVRICHRLPRVHYLLCSAVRS